MGREGEALSILRERATEPQPEIMRAFLASLQALLEGKARESVAATEKTLAHLHDPEAQYVLARQLARLGERARALEQMRKVVDQGFHVPQAFARDPWLDSIRDDPRFVSTLEIAERGRREAARAFLDTGGEALLGLRPA
jgi:hypothetical protein